MNSMNGRQLSDHICRTLRDRGHQAYLAGGCVRDILLRREPVDYDVATDATPDRVQELFPNSLTVGAKFGVVVVIDGPTQVEVATFRSDVGYSDGRHPDRVEYARSPEEDVKRRDFTINGLMLDPFSNEVLDFVGGEKDLRAGIIRAIGNPEDRFREDKLRMIRAVRFAARFRYAIESGTFVAITKLAPDIFQVSAERIRDELTKILTEGAVWIHTLMMIEQLKPGCSPTLAWGVLLHDVGKPPTFTPQSGPDSRIRFDRHVEVGAKMAEEICRRLRFSNDDTAQIVALVANHLRFKDVGQMKLSTLKRFVRLNHFEEHLELHRLDCLSSHRNLSAYDFVQRFLAETPAEQVHPPRLLTGEDLKALGYPPGPRFKEILAALEDAQLNGTINNREEALRLIRDNFTASPG